MTSSDPSGNRGRTAPAGEDPAVAVPEADAAEQRTPAGDEDRDDWFEEPPEGALDQANEADVIEQVREAGPDEEEHR
ncbi:hypothetical protein GCM10007079_12730 [Nocardiopsis terrae]|uniref:Uncharacterized protein n=1 Tax=Nocardiopsis terrae TaxID=372655 RepID=A0ABR9HBW8_9ACTN|nr:hypothetical protein [Nocardiopsis terrae]MBE1456519.1 hypothetical protein [Nocardiopsis terrae]GHC76421.1 hypothetical protein GCM10007079_12730 [Nocardiopsis terrae]